jgi:hypothetical protein
VVLRNLTGMKHPLLFVRCAATASPELGRPADAPL